MDLEVYIVESLHINIVSFADLDRIKFIERCERGFIFGEITWYEVEKLYMWSLKCDTKFLRKEIYITNVERKLQLENKIATNKEKKLIEVEELMGKWGVSPTMMKKIIKNGVIKGIDFDAKLIDDLKQNYGLPIEYLVS